MILIVCTGRCGSSFLVHLLTEMGMDTGYDSNKCIDVLNNWCRGGLEWTIDKPYEIKKNPNFLPHIENILDEYGSKIDHIIIPMRNAKDVAKSREVNNKNHGGYGGFCFGAKGEIEQMQINDRLMYNLFWLLTERDVPYTTISFPRMVNDREYLRKKLLEVWPFSKLFLFNDAFEKCADPKKITIK